MGMNNQDTIYVLELTPEQSRAIQRACEFYARMRFGQFQEVTWQLMNFRDDDFCERRDKAEDLLFEARKFIYPELETRGHSYGVGRDYEADSAWEVYEALRYEMAWHEHPEGGITVNFDQPMRFAGAGVPKCFVKEQNELEVEKDGSAKG